MASQTMPQLSLVAQYDDLCRHSKILIGGCEKEFKQFLENQKRRIGKRREAEAELESLRKKVASYEYEKQRYEAQLKHVRNLVREEMERRKKLEQEKASLERQIALIKEVLLNNGNTMDNQTKERLFQLSSTYKPTGGSPSRLTTIEESIGSLLSPSEIDDSDEDTDNAITQRKRRSKGKKSSGDQSLKKLKSEVQAHRLSFENAFRFDDHLPNKNIVNFQSNSEATSDSSETPIYRPVKRSESEQMKNFKRSDTIHFNGGTPAGRYSLGGRPSKPHAFVSKTVIRAEKCNPCNRAVNFCKNILKCTNCRITCHPECKDKCPLPCIPASCTPTKGAMATISDYAPTCPPMIPSIIVHCVNKIESTGLKEVGLYRISGSDREVKDLKEKFLRGKSIPSLNDVDIHAVCGTIKDFLRSLKDTLITRAAWQTFVDAASYDDENLSLSALYTAVCDLPQANKDTLAFLILHLQRVAASPDCKMPLENLAKVFGPTIIGYSVSDPNGSNMLTETRLQCQVMERLLTISADLWQDILNVETDVFHTPMKTPEITPAPVSSRLGPIYTSSQKSKNTPVTKTPLKPRTLRNGSKVGKRQFFSSPLLK